MDYQAWELWGVRLQEERTENFHSIARFCYTAASGGTATTNAAAAILGQRADWVKRIARVYSFWGKGDPDPELFAPDVPLNVYEVATQMRDPVHALRMAVDPEYRRDEGGIDDGKGRWSARQLQDWYDGERGQKVSRVKWFGGPVGLEMDDGKIVLAPRNGWTPGGEIPEEAEAVIREVIR
jgi:hypothetical protein